MGMLGITIREEDGGIGGTLMDAVITIQELAMLCPKRCRCGAGGQFRADPHLCRIRHPRPKGALGKFAEMTVKLEAAQMLLYRAAQDADANGLPSALDTAVAKLACNEAGFDAANEAMQAMGAYGYSTESLVEYCLKRTCGWQISGGSLEMLKNRIPEHVFDRRFNQRPS